MTITASAGANATTFHPGPGYQAQGKHDDNDWKLLTPEDLSFLNALGITPTPLFDRDRAMCVVKRIYADPANPDKKVQPSDVAYYGGEVARHNESAIESLTFILKQPSLDDTVRANIQQTLDSLVSTRETAKSQMRSLLAEAKLLLMQRGVDGEAQVIETIQTIDAVLNNMSIQDANTSGHASTFLELYSKEVKQKCEIAVGRGRDPIPLDEHLVKSRGTAPDKERLERAIESVRPQARTMAEELKRLLAPYAEPVFQGNVRKPEQDKNQGRLVGAWQLA